MPHRKFAIAALFALLALLGLPLCGLAQSPALDFTSLGRGFDYTQGSYSLGWTFRTNSSITITHLGFYDDLKNGVVGSHPVGIYDLTTHALLTSATVSSADPLTGFFRYTPVAPVTLAAGRDYTIQAVTGTDRYVGDVNTTVMNPAITFTGIALDYNSSATSIVFPTSFTGNIFGSPLPPDFYGDFGPNFKFVPATPATRPTIQSFTPASVTAGSAPFPLIISGQGFVAGTTSVRFDNTVMPIASMTASQIVVNVPTSLLTASRRYNILVAVGSKYSNAVAFSVTPALSNPLAAPSLQVIGNLRTGVDTGVRYVVFQFQNKGTADLTNISFSTILLHVESGVQAGEDLGGVLQTLEPLTGVPPASLALMHPGDVIQARFIFPALSVPGSGIVTFAGSSAQGSFNAGIHSVTIP